MNPNMQQAHHEQQLLNVDTLEKAHQQVRPLLYNQRHIAPAWHLQLKVATSQHDAP